MMMDLEIELIKAKRIIWNAKLVEAIELRADKKEIELLEDIVIDLTEIISGIKRMKKYEQTWYNLINNK